jgi:protocatechuate 3,4-dioxygenase beta subunit
MNKDVLKNLKKQVVNLDVYDSIKILKTEEKGAKIDVQAQLKSAGNNQYSSVKVDKYIAEGIVKDANGKPVSGAVVSMIENDPEGWAKEKPTNEKGEYSLIFIHLIRSPCFE